MKKSVIIKRISAIILLSTYFLPYCEGWFSFGNDYPYELFDTKGLFAWLFLMAYVWPFPLLIYTYFVKRKMIVIVLTLIEPILCSLSLFIILGNLGFFDTLKYGTYLTAGSLLSYLIVSCNDIFIMVKQYIRNKRAGNSIHTDAKDLTAFGPGDARH